VRHVRNRVRDGSEGNTGVGAQQRHCCPFVQPETEAAVAVGELLACSELRVIAVEHAQELLYGHVGTDQGQVRPE